MQFKRSLKLLQSRLALQRLLLNSLAAFGAISGLFQFYSAVWVPKESLPAAWQLSIAVVTLSLAFGLWRAWPRRRVSISFKNPAFDIEIKFGDIFEQPGNLVIGFSDTFDTDTTNDEIISSRSLQGQLLHKIYEGDIAALDARLEQSLELLSPISTEEPEAKKGKLKRYPIGTTVPIRKGGRLYYCTAYTRMNNNLVASSSIGDLWSSLNNVWIQSERASPVEDLSIAIIGSELARVTAFDKDALIRLIILSYVAASRERRVSSRLSVVARPADYESIDTVSLREFMRSMS